MRAEEFGFDALAGDLARADREIGKEAKQITTVAMAKMKKDAQRRVRGYPHLPHLARSFTYDVTVKGDTVVGEVGGDWDRLQGKLDGYIEAGTVNSPAIPHWRPAADTEVPIWHRFLEEAAAGPFDA